MPQKTLFIIDDSAINRILLRRIFEAEYHIEEAGDGRRALEMLRAGGEVSLILLDLFMPELDGYGVLEALHADARLKQIPVIVVTASDDDESQIRALNLGAEDVLTKPFNPEIVLHRARNLIGRIETIRRAEEARQVREILRLTEISEKTGIYNKKTFCRVTAEAIARAPEKRYVILHWDLDRFKVFNDSFGTREGDRLLSQIGSAYRDGHPGLGRPLTYGHWDADHFVCCFDAAQFDLSACAASVRETVQAFYPSYKLEARLGAYRVDDSVRDVALMCDRALLALHSIKDHCDLSFAYYEDSMRQSMLEEQELVSDMRPALLGGQFVPYIQPQYDYAQGKLTGAETLVRWEHPEKGLISPAKFIPLFERNGFICRLDETIWRQACALQRRWLDKGLRIVPLSVNVSRRDIYNPGLCALLEGLVREYRLEPAMLHLEITESAYVENPEQLIRTVEELRRFGFPVEMDDFGSGYSSLNTLKNVPVDVLKLDMAFTKMDSGNPRGGSILTSIVRMAHWLNLPIVAEGVETRVQADYLKSVGCSVMQGYYFARPMPVSEYEALLSGRAAEPPQRPAQAAECEAAVDLLSASTQSALFFNCFTAGAAIMEACCGEVETLRVNDRFFEALGRTIDSFHGRPIRLRDFLDEAAADGFLKMLERADAERAEADCEIVLGSGADARFLCVRARFLSTRFNRRLYFVSLENITEQRRLQRRCAALAERYDALAANFAGGILEYAVDLNASAARITRFNDLAAEMFGFTRAQFAAEVCPDSLRCVHPDDLEALRGQLMRALRLSAPLIGCQYRHSCRDGRWRYVMLSGRVLRIENGIALCSAVQIDMDSRRALERQLSTLQARSSADTAPRIEAPHERALIESLLDAIPGGLVTLEICAHSPKLVYCSGGVADMLGLSVRELMNSVNRAHNLHICPTDSERLHRSVRRALSGGEALDENFRLETAEGRLIWVNLRGRLVPLEGGRSRLYGVFHNLTATGDMYQNILNEADRVVQVCDAQTREILFINRAGLELASHARSQMTGLRCHKALFNRDEPCEGCPIDHPEAPGQMEYDGFHYETHVKRILWNGRDAYVEYIADTTRRWRLQQRLHAREQRFSTIVENMPAGVGIFDFGETCAQPVYISNQALALFGCTREAPGEAVLPDFLPERSEFSAAQLGALGRGEIVELPHRLVRRPDGSSFYLLTVLRMAANPDGGADMCYAVFRNVDDQVRRSRRAEWQAERYRLLSEAAGVLLFDYDPDEDLMRFSLPVLGKGVTEEVHRLYIGTFAGNLRIHPDSREAYLLALKRACVTPGEASLDYRANYYGLGYNWYRTLYISLADEGGHIFRVIGRVENIDALMRKQQSIICDGGLDGVTGLRCKDAARQLVELALRDRPAARRDALLFIDVDNFKAINDTLGHLMGDTILKRFADVLKRSFRTDDIVARFGGDEFLVYLRSVGDLQFARRRAQQVIDGASRIQLESGGTLSCSIGVAPVQPGEDFDALFHRADCALYVSKRLGKNRYSVHSGEETDALCPPAGIESEKEQAGEESDP